MGDCVCVHDLEVTENIAVLFQKEKVCSGRSCSRKGRINRHSVGFN